MGTRTKTYVHTMPGIPAVTSAAGTLVAFLDAVLVNGFNEISVGTIAVSGGVCTVQTGTNHGLVGVGGAGTASTGLVMPVVSISGCDQAALNGEFRVSKITDATHFKFNLSVADVTGTGATIKTKYAPLGWAIEYTDTNRRVYRQVNVKGTRLYLYVDDNTVAGRAHVTMYEAMTGIDAGTRPIPTTTQLSSGFLEWGHIVYASETPKKITIVGDDLIFYMMMERPNGNVYDTNNYVCCGFGDPISYVPNDTYGCALWGSNAIGSTAEDCFSKYAFGYSSNANTCLWMARESNNTSSAGCMFFNMWGSWPTGIKWPSLADNSLIINPVYLGDVEAAGNTVRGMWPGLFGFVHCNQHVNGDAGGLTNSAVGLDHLSSLGPLADLGGHTYLIHYMAGTATDKNPGLLVVFNGDGDWR